MAGSLACFLFCLAVINFQGFEGISATPAPGSDQEAACSTLQQVADRSAICSTTSTCTQLHCETAGISTDLTVLPCASSPSVSVVATQNGRTIYSHIFSRSEVVPIATPSGIPFMSLNVSLVVSPNQDFMTLEVTAIPLLGPPVNIFPKTKIPLSRSQCNSAVTSSRSSTTSGSVSGTTPSSAPPVHHAKTCQALQNIAQRSASQCSTVDSCTSLDCNFMGQYHARLTVEPCHDPPAVGVVIRDALGETLVDETLVSSRTQPIRWNGVYLFDLIINISHMRDPDSIVLKVSVHSAGLGGHDLEVVPATPIPIDRCGCPGVTCPTEDGGKAVAVTDPTPDSAKQTSRLVTIVTPVAVVVGLLLVTIVVVVLVMGVVYSKRKQAQAYSFHRVTFDTANEEDGEEG